MGHTYHDDHGDGNRHYRILALILLQPSTKNEPKLQPSSSKRLYAIERKLQRRIFIMAVTRELVENALEKTRDALRGDGGDVELVDVSDDGVVEVRLKGACHGCPMATMTLKSLIERVLKKELPEIKEVIAVA
jgi:Fe-S cluster biogenesis protein NfuA